MISRKHNLIWRLRQAFMRLFFNLLYNRCAWSYDLVADIVSLGMWKDWVKSVTAYLDGPRILELGHGPGHLQVALYEKSASKVDCMQILGLDKSKQMGKIAYRRLMKHNYLPVLINGDAQSLPLPNESIHQVVTTFPSTYISNLQTLDEIRRILAPGGQIVILPLAWITGKKPHQRAAAKLFDITGQAPAWDDRYLYPLISKGFHAQIEHVVHTNSHLLILIMTKT